MISKLFIIIGDEYCCLNLFAGVETTSPSLQRDTDGRPCFLHRLHHWVGASARGIVTVGKPTFCREEHKSGCIGRALVTKLFGPMFRYGAVMLQKDRRVAAG